MESITVGVDVSKKFLDIFDSQSQKHIRFFNTKEGCDKLLSRYTPNNTKIIMESTGVYQNELQKAATQHGITVHIVNPYRVRQFARALGKIAKNDRLDANVLCEYGKTVDLKTLLKRTDHELELVALIRHRIHLVQQKITISNHREATDNDFLQQELQDEMGFYEQKIKECEQKIQTCIQRNEELLRKQTLLKTAPGIGNVISWHLLAFLPELGKINREEIGALCGLAPMVCESGSIRGRAMIKGGRSIIRHVLYRGSLVFTRGQSFFKQKYDNFKARGKASKVALIACMRQLLVRLNIMIRNNEPWRA